MKDDMKNKEIIKKNRNKEISSMKKLSFLTVIVCCMFLITAAGNINLLAFDSGDASVAGEKHEHKAKKKHAKICGHCGEIKGGEKCCKADAKKCPKCKLNAGSPGCCKIEKGKDVALCGKCGELKGGEKCCKADAKKCPKCKKNAGSPGCCIAKKPKKEKA